MPKMAQKRDTKLAAAFTYSLQAKCFKAASKPTIGAYFQASLNIPSLFLWVVTVPPKKNTPEGEE
jgi:hypothetical protein